MIPNYKQKEHDDIADQVAEFERLNGKVKTDPIRSYGKTIKVTTGFERTMKTKQKELANRQKAPNAK